MLDKLKLIVRYNAGLFIKNAAGKKALRIHGLSVIILIILVYTAFTWLFISELVNEELSYLLATIMFVIGVVYALMGLLILTTKYTDFSRSIIPRNLLLLPLSSSRLFLMILGDLLINVNTLCFLGASIVILASVSTAGIFIRLIPVGISLLFSVAVTIWAVNLYILSAKYFTKNRHLVMMIPYMLFFAVQISMQTSASEKAFNNFVAVPVVRKLFSGILFSVTGDWMQLAFSGTILILVAAVGLVVGQVLIRRFRHNLAG